MGGRAAGARISDCLPREHPAPTKLCIKLKFIFIYPCSSTIANLEKSVVVLHMHFIITHLTGQQCQYQLEGEDTGTVYSILIIIMCSSVNTNSEESVLTLFSLVAHVISFIITHIIITSCNNLFFLSLAQLVLPVSVFA